ncbi:MAG: NUDIX hydrolase [Kordiimonadaceae bacterium]|jgi:8-oxo-dGTP diphosphatase|nr:NUDIX hydrolase [Kordiimonadaceae bacterium]MBT6035107.1 NUDIX hydrolase [Kordiimonadaceae bacterium]MBT6330321.1 NUDIX hydrolase [Kordiimonadaceae bacterium]MBT7583184.1 NUDIX hydrolase [Kordiimonadaceae bacterium]
MKRDYPDRPITAVGVVVLKGGDVLLIKRNKPPKTQLWSIPGGAQDLGEPLLKTAAREVLEETGISIKNITLLDALDFIERDDKAQVKFHYSLIDYGAEYDAGDLKAGDDAMEAKWVSFDDLEHYKLWQETIDIIEKARIKLGQ